MAQLNSALDYGSRGYWFESSRGHEIKIPFLTKWDFFFILKHRFLMLKEEGLNVTLDQAEEILYFLRKLANIQVIRYLEKIERRNKND